MTTTAWRLVANLNKLARQTSARKAARPKRLPAGTFGAALPAETRSSARPVAVPPT